MVAGCTQNYYVTVHVPESNVTREKGENNSSTFDFMLKLKPEAFNVADTFYLDTCLLRNLKPPKGTVFAN